MNRGLAAAALLSAVLGVLLYWLLVVESEVIVVVLGEMSPALGAGHILRTAKGKGSRFSLSTINNLTGVAFAGSVDTVMATRHPEPPGAEHWVSLTIYNTPDSLNLVWYSGRPRALERRGDPRHHGSTAKLRAAAGGATVQHAGGVS